MQTAPKSHIQNLFQRRSLLDSREKKQDYQTTLLQFSYVYPQYHSGSISMCKRSTMTKQYLVNSELVRFAQLAVTPSPHVYVCGVWR